MFFSDNIDSSGRIVPVIKGEMLATLQRHEIMELNYPLRFGVQSTLFTHVSPLQPLSHMQNSVFQSHLRLMSDLQKELSGYPKKILNG